MEHASCIAPIRTIERIRGQADRRAFSGTIAFDQSVIVAVAPAAAAIVERVGRPAGVGIGAGKRGFVNAPSECDDVIRRGARQQKAEGYRTERSLMDCVAPPSKGGRRNPSVTLSRFLVAKGDFRPTHPGLGKKERERTERERTRAKSRKEGRGRRKEGEHGRASD